MEGIEYYKSLITDEEVIKALTKESQAREGILEKPRVRPNLNFLQRTVSNMVSSNKRLTIHKGNTKEKEKNCSYRLRKSPVHKKHHMEFIQDILSKKVDFEKSTDEQNGGNKIVSSHHRNLFNPIKSESGERQTYKKKNSISKHKTQLEVVREILIGRIDSLKACKTACKSSDSEKNNSRNQQKYGQVANIKTSVRKNGVCSYINDEVITLDSDSSSSNSDNTDLKSDSKNISQIGKKEKYISGTSEDSEISNCTDDPSRKERKKNKYLEHSSKTMESNNDGHSRRNIRKPIIEVFNISDSDSVDEENHY